MIRYRLYWTLGIGFLLRVGAAYFYQSNLDPQEVIQTLNPIASLLGYDSGSAPAGLWIKAHAIFIQNLEYFTKCSPQTSLFLSRTLHIVLQFLLIGIFYKIVLFFTGRRLGRKFAFMMATFWVLSPLAIVSSVLLIGLDLIQGAATLVMGLAWGFVFCFSRKRNLRSLKISKTIPGMVGAVFLIASGVFVYQTRPSFIKNATALETIGQDLTSLNPAEHRSLLQIEGKPEQYAGQFFLRFAGEIQYVEKIENPTFLAIYPNSNAPLGYRLWLPISSPKIKILHADQNALWTSNIKVYLQNEADTWDFEVTLSQNQITPQPLDYAALTWEIDQAKGIRFLNRAYRWNDLEEPSYLGGLTPIKSQFQLDHKLLELGTHSGIEQIKLEPLQAGGMRATLELYEPLNHPLHIYTKCAKSLDEPVSKRSLDLPYRPTTLLAHFYLRQISPHNQSKWPMPGRYPYGKSAAFVFTDHADQANPERLTPIAQEFVNRQMSFTKTVFTKPALGYAKQLPDPDFRKILEGLQISGSDIGLHSVSGASDTTQQTQSGIDFFRKYFEEKLSTRTWIDHQPMTNCEAIMNQGWNASSPFYSLNAIKQAGFQYLWNDEDLPVGESSINLLNPKRIDQRSHVLYSIPALSEGLTFFSSAWFYRPLHEINRLTASRNLARLQEEYGLTIAHTYLDTFRPGSPNHVNSVLERNPNGALQIQPQFKALLDRLSAENIWVTALEPMADTLLHSLEVEVHPTRIKNEFLLKSDYAITGFTLLINPQEMVEIPKPIGSRAWGEYQMVWFDLEKGATKLRVVAN